MVIVQVTEVWDRVPSAQCFSDHDVRVDNLLTHRGGGKPNGFFQLDQPARRAKFRLFIRFFEHGNLNCWEDRNGTERGARRSCSFDNGFSYWYVHVVGSDHLRQAVWDDPPEHYAPNDRKECVSSSTSLFFRVEGHHLTSRSGKLRVSDVVHVGFFTYVPHVLANGEHACVISPGVSIAGVIVSLTYGSVCFVFVHRIHLTTGNVVPRLLRDNLRWVRVTTAGDCVDSFVGGDLHHDRAGPDYPPYGGDRFSFGSWVRGGPPFNLLCRVLSRSTRWVLF